MKFNKHNAKYYGRRGGKASAVARTLKNGTSKQAANNEQQAFAEFLAAKRGYFNGFDFVNLFHRKYSKNNAILTTYTDDSGNAAGVHVGIDGAEVYFFCKPEQATKIVLFNRSVYVFGVGV